MIFAGLAMMLAGVWSGKDEKLSTCSVYDVTTFSRKVDSLDLHPGQTWVAVSDTAEVVGRGNEPGRIKIPQGTRLIYICLTRSND